MFVSCKTPWMILFRLLHVWSRLVLIVSNSQSAINLKGIDACRLHAGTINNPQVLSKSSDLDLDMEKSTPPWRIITRSSCWAPVAPLVGHPLVHLQYIKPPGWEQGSWLWKQSDEANYLTKAKNNGFPNLFVCHQKQVLCVHRWASWLVRSVSSWSIGKNIKGRAAPINRPTVCEVTPSMTCGQGARTQWHCTKIFQSGSWTCIERTCQTDNIKKLLQNRVLDQLLIKQAVLKLQDFASTNFN